MDLIHRVCNIRRRRMSRVGCVPKTLEEYEWMDSDKMAEISEWLNDLCERRRKRCVVLIVEIHEKGAVMCPLTDEVYPGQTLIVICNHVAARHYTLFVVPADKRLRWQFFDSLRPWSDKEAVQFVRRALPCRKHRIVEETLANYSGDWQTGCVCSLWTIWPAFALVTDFGDAWRRQDFSRAMACLYEDPRGVVERLCRSG